MFFTDILAGFTFNNRVLRLPALIVFMGLLESLDVYPKKARVSGSKRRVNKTINAGRRRTLLLLSQDVPFLFLFFLFSFSKRDEESAYKLG